MQEPRGEHLGSVFYPKRQLNGLEHPGGHNPLIGLLPLNYSAGTFLLPSFGPKHSVGTGTGAAPCALSSLPSTAPGHAQSVGLRLSLQNNIWLLGMRVSLPRSTPPEASLARPGPPPARGSVSPGTRAGLQFPSRIEQGLAARSQLPEPH